MFLIQLSKKAVLFYSLVACVRETCKSVHENKQAQIGINTLALAGFHAGPLTWSHWNLKMLVFVEGRKSKNLQKNPRSKARTNMRLDPTVWHRAGIEPRPHWWEEMQALSPLRHPCSPQYSFRCDKSECSMHKK